MILEVQYYPYAAHNFQNPWNRIQKIQCWGFKIVISGSKFGNMEIAPQNNGIGGN